MNHKMKAILLTLNFGLSTMVNSQSVDKLKTAQKFGWCGVDYSKVRCIGSEFFADPNAIVNEYFTKWNDLVIAEPSKYQVNKACRKKLVLYTTEVSAKANLTASVEGLVIDTDYALTESDITEMVQSYPPLENVDVGLVLIAEALNKNIDKGIMYAVFFDAKTQEIIWKKKYVGDTGGFGFRNHWATSIAEILEDLAKDFKRITSNNASK